VTEGWEIISVHPPDGQGPFVIPRPPNARDIERSSYHPDIVAIRPKEGSGAEVIIVECKLNFADLNDDRDKLTNIAASRFSLLFILFRCQSFANGPRVGIDYETVKSLATDELPIQFGLAAHAEHDSVNSSTISGFPCTTFLFSRKSLS